MSTTEANPAPASRTGGRADYSGLPRWLYVPAAAGALFVLLPLVAMVLRMDWTRFGELITSESSVAALELSLRTSVSATLACLVLGVPLALALARRHFPGRDLVRSIVLLPLVLPPVVGGIALLYTFGRRGLLGGTLDVLGIPVAFTTTAVVIAQTFVALPFLVVSLEGTLRTVGQRYELVAATLGARPSTVLRRVTLPLLLPGLASATVLSFARALALEIYLQRVDDPDAAIALSLVLVGVAVVVMLVTNRISQRALTWA